MQRETVKLWSSRPARALKGFYQGLLWRDFICSRATLSPVYLGHVRLYAFLHPFPSSLYCLLLGVTNNQEHNNIPSEPDLV